MNLLRFNELVSVNRYLLCMGQPFFGNIHSYVLNFYLQAHNLSKDHKPDLEAEKDRILKAGGFIQVGRVNGSLNLARAIGSRNSFFL